MVNELLEDVLYGPAQVLMGSALTDDALLAAAREEFEGREYRVVRDWMILDVMVSEQDEKLIHARELQPVTLFAGRVLYDSRGVRQGTAMLSGFMRHVEDCFFEAEEMVYVLGGRGARKHVSMPALTELSRMCRLLRKGLSQNESWLGLDRGITGG